MKHNGSIIAFGREWVLYEHWIDGVMKLRMLPDDEIEMRQLETVIQFPWE